MTDRNLEQLLEGYDPDDYPDGWEESPAFNTPPRPYVDEAEGLLGDEAEWSMVSYLAFALQEADDVELESELAEYDASRT
jgi:hypothetical protein